MKSLLITGRQGIGKSTAAKVAAQIAQQHHGITALRLDEDELLGRPIRLGGTSLVIRTRTTGTAINKALSRPDAVINLDRHPYPNGRVVTFLLREAIDRLVKLEQQTGRQAA